MEITYKDIIIDTDMKTSYQGDLEVPLTKLEYKVLLYLVEHPGKIFTRKELIEECWDKTPSLRSVDVVITRLKKKFQNSNLNIVTRLGYGYGLNK